MANDSPKLAVVSAGSMYSRVVVASTKKAVSEWSESIVTL